jgi:hypothetical protein
VGELGEDCAELGDGRFDGLDGGRTGLDVVVLLGEDGRMSTISPLLRLPTGTVVTVDVPAPRPTASAGTLRRQLPLLPPLSRPPRSPCPTPGSLPSPSPSDRLNTLLLAYRYVRLVQRAIWSVMEAVGRGWIDG